MDSHPHEELERGFAGRCLVRETVLSSELGGMDRFERDPGLALCHHGSGIGCCALTHRSFLVSAGHQRWFRRSRGRLRSPALLIRPSFLISNRCRRSTSGRDWLDQPLAECTGGAATVDFLPCREYLIPGPVLAVSEGRAVEFAVAPEGSADWPVFHDGRLRPAVQCFGLCNSIQGWSADCANMAFYHQPGRCYDVSRHAIFGRSFPSDGRSGETRRRPALLGASQGCFPAVRADSSGPLDLAQQPAGSADVVQVKAPLVGDAEGAATLSGCFSRGLPRRCAGQLLCRPA
mmetsp:Transcript_7210/g.17088  ORF Transcript_7210/g.17088 Transcript_7210/m.17088 type:complete len:290 (+) Transcript_7210:475-1344(+)